MAKVLVVGGAGYVGSATCAQLVDQGHSVWVLDDLSTGHRVLAVGKGFTFGKAGDPAVLEDLLSRESFECVMHFAARSLVAESVQNPDIYFENNVTQTEQLLEVLLKHGIRNFIFSSTCAIYGCPSEAKISETVPKNPVNPYGASKLAVEKRLEELSQQKGLRAISFRYFNAAGAEPQLRVGEWHEPESHLIPRILKAAISSEAIEIYGKEHPTPDGSCVRDYVHVSDIAAAHIAGMERLLGGGAAAGLAGLYEAYNLGSENGYSVLEVISACERVLGKSLVTVEKPSRAGDPPSLVADATLARQVLGFRNLHSNLDEIISSAWAWEKKRTQILRPAIFLDRDGTLNDDPGYLHDPALMKLLPHVGEALAMLQAQGYLLVVVSNQSGVARGFIDPEAIPRIHRRLDELLKPWSVRIEYYSLCFHHPDEECECRKPKPALILEAANRLQLDITRSFMIGDRESDIGAGQAAGCKGTLLVKTGFGKKLELPFKKTQPDFVAESLLDAARWILGVLA